MHHIVAAVCLLLFSPIALSEPNYVREIDRFLKSEMQDRHIPGLQLAVVRDGQIVLSRSYGTADLANDVPVTEKSVFSINSATKSFTGVAVMQLVESGKVALDAPVSRYIDGLPETWQRVTITQLLNHTSGLPDIIDQRRSPQAVTDDPAAAWAAVQLQPLESAPGERFSYNQTNYLLLGKVIDKLAAKPFTDFMRERQFVRAGMTNTAFGDSYHLVRYRAPAWRWDGRSHLPAFDQFPDFLLTGAGINSSARELAQWLIALQQEKLISKTSLGLLWRAGTFNDGRTAPWALGWPVTSNGNVGTVGGMGGARSAFFVYPEQGLAVVMLTNLRGGAPEELIDAVAARVAPPMRGKIDGNYTAYLLRESLRNSGYENIGTRLAQLKRSGMADPREAYLNSWAYRLSRTKQHAEALAVFRLAAELYPRSANAHDSLAEGLEAAGQPMAAAEAYRRSLVLDAGNTHATDRLKAISLGQ